MNKEKIIEILKPSYQADELPNIEKFASYIIRLETEIDTKTKKLKNLWLKGRTEQQMAELYNRVAKDGLVFDGKHITLQSTGVSYDYIAYKNKMLLAYPESKIDMELVFDGDVFSVAKESGSVIYHHEISNPFNRDEKNVIGAYCVICNKRGDSLTLLSKEELEKHRKVAKTDFIWRQWFLEMALKTVIKKACKKHFDDVYENIEAIDNDNYDLENPIGLDLKYKQEIEAIKNIEELNAYYTKNKGLGADFDKMIVKKKEELQKPLDEQLLDGTMTINTK